METLIADRETGMAVSGVTAEEIGRVAQIADRERAPIWELFSYRVLDSEGESVGSVEQVWTDGTTDRPKFIGVRTGWFWKRTHVIPAVDGQIDAKARSIRVGYPTRMIRGAPVHNTHRSLSSPQERNVRAYYGNS